MKLADVLRLLTTQLDDAGAAFAVVGGLAASARGEARFTRDIDVAVVVDNDEQAERYIFELRQHGYEVMATVEHAVVGRLATARLMHKQGVVTDFIFATCGIEREVVESAEVIEILPSLKVPTASAEALLAMKVLSVTAQRPRDQGDIQAILRCNPNIDDLRVRDLLRSIEARGYSREQDLVSKWERLRLELGV